MTINRRIVGASVRLSKEFPTGTGLRSNIMPFLNQGMVIPIISNSFRIEQIFREESGVSGDTTETPQPANNEQTIDEQLTNEWADLIDYPMPDKLNLARVAQYFLVEQKDSLRARVKYLEFLKTLLLTIAQDEENKNLIDGLKMQVQEKRFSEIVRQLDYPKFPENAEDTLRLLARFPLPIYITTSYYNFLERALQAEGKTPHTMVCFWSGVGSNEKYEDWPDPEPTVKTPVVYHLYGLEDYPQTLVLSEDDFMDFLVNVLQDTNKQNPIIPLKLRQALVESPLLLLGYQLRDWDFRVLFRFILKCQKALSPRGMVIQLKADRKRIGEAEKSIRYLSDYFDINKFDVEWTETEKFIRKLWDEWNKYRQGQS